MDAIPLINRFQPSRFATMTYDELIAEGLSDKIDDLSRKELIALVTCLALEFKESLTDGRDRVRRACKGRQDPA